MTAFGDGLFGGGTFGGLVAPTSGVGYLIEVDFTTPLLGTPTDWIDVTEWVRAFSTRRGRSHELGKMQAGEASLTLDNRDRRFDPTYTSGPYYPSIVPMRHARVRATTSLGTYDLFRGFVEDWGQQWSGPHATGMGDATCEAHLVDAFKVLNLIDLTPYQDEVLKDKPLFYYPFNEANPGVDYTALTFENLGSVEDATLVHDPSQGGMTLGATGGHLPGGETSAADMVMAGGVPSYEVTTLPASVGKKFSGPWSIESWFNPGATNSPAEIFTVLNSYVWASLAYGYAVFGAASKMVVARGGSVTAPISITTGTLTPGTWYHLAAVYDGDTTTRIYRNGVLWETLTTVERVVEKDPTLTTVQISGDNVTGNRRAHTAAYGYALTPERIAAHYAANIGTMAAQTVDSAITTILDVIGWGPRSITTSGHTISAHTADHNALTELLMLAEDVDGGILFMQADGTLRFRSADHLRGDTAAAAAWGDTTAELRYSGLTFRYDDEDLYTEVRATATDLVDAVASDAAAAVTYGSRTLESSAGVLGTQEQLNDRATGYLTRYKTPAVRPETLLAVDSTTQPSRADEMFASEIGRRVTVTRRPPGGGSAITINSLVEGVAHSPVEALLQCRTTLNLVPVLDQTPWILDSATYSVLDSTTDLGW